MRYYDAVEKFVCDAFQRKGGRVVHYLRTVHWVKQLKPDADEALLIAAVAHDIERGFSKETLTDKVGKLDKGLLSEDFLEHHQMEGARIITEFLESINAEPGLINRVGNLVSRHEFGGSADQNILKDADSISFLENSVDIYVTKIVHEIGKGKVRDKLRWMFGRITSEKAREICREWYENGLKRLDEIE